MQSPVLVVDDNPAVQDFICMALFDEHYDVITASDGAEALEAVKRYQPSLILLDMQMPVMDGFEFLSVYCTEVNSAPVIAFSANAIDVARLPCVAAFIPKPFDLDALIELIERYK